MKAKNNIVLWQKLSANYKQQIEVGGFFFHYEILLTALAEGDISSKQCTYKTESIIKFCVASCVFNERHYDFLINPIDRVSRCIQLPEITLDWHDVTFIQPVLSKSELNYDEQKAIHLLRLESLIREKFLEEAKRAFIKELDSEVSI